MHIAATTEMMGMPVITDKMRGAIGVDLNADHLGVAETDASGNRVNAFGVLLVTSGKCQHQAEAIIGDAVSSVVADVHGHIERLDFRQKKVALEGEDCRYSRMLSSFTYVRIRACFLSRGYPERVCDNRISTSFPTWLALMRDLYSRFRRNDEVGRKHLSHTL